MGNYYKNTSPTYRSLRVNLPNLNKSYMQNTSGYFGKQGKSSQIGKRQIFSNNPIEEAKSFYNKIAYGGIEKAIGNRGYVTKLRDGTWITFREITSTPNSPAVEININNSNDNCKISNQKIHFEKKEK